MSKSPWLIDPATGATGETYEIRAVEDFFNVPAERRRVCLREFHSWMAVLEEFPIILAEVDPELMKAIHIKRDVFRWHDDGKGAVVSSIHISQADAEAQSASSTPPGEQPGKSKATSGVPATQKGLSEG
jgi:hypothetical protein